MLQLRPNCECCNRDLPPESADAFICSFECTFCRSCKENVLGGKCPNCDGELVRGRGARRRSSRSIRPQLSGFTSRRAARGSFSFICTYSSAPTSSRSCG